MLNLLKFLIAPLRLEFGGGGDGGGNSGGNDTLWNAQAEKVKQDQAMAGRIFDEWEKRAPGFLNNTQKMVDEANSGVLTTRMRNQAGADASTALGQGLDASTRRMERYGAEFNPTAMAQSLRDAGITSALTKSHAMNTATQWGENQKWARNQDALGQVSGMPGNATQMSNSANMGLTNLSGITNSQNNLAAQNAAGWGRMGSAAAYSMMKRDGGEVSLKDLGKRGLRAACGGKAHRPVRLATGGMPTNPVAGWRERVAAMPTVSNTRANVNGLESAVSGAMPVVVGEGLKGAGKAAWKGLKGAYDDATSQAPAHVQNGPTDMLKADTPTTSNLAPTNEPGAMADEVLKDGVDAAGEQLAQKTGEAVAEEGVKTAVAEGVGEAGLSSTLGAAIPYVGLALAAGKALKLFKDGGESRVNMITGGKVEGPGTPTSDSIPAWLSDKEYVLNAEAVDMIGKDTLDEINEKGLKARYGNQAKMVDGEAKPNGLAFGGMLGIAAGAGVDQWNEQRQQTRLDEASQRAKDMLAIQQEELGLRRDAGKRADRYADVYEKAEKRAQTVADRETADRLRLNKLFNGDGTEENPGNRAVWANHEESMRASGATPAQIASAKKAFEADQLLEAAKIGPNAVSNLVTLGNAARADAQLVEQVRHNTVNEGFKGREVTSAEALNNEQKRRIAAEATKEEQLEHVRAAHVAATTELEAAQTAYTAAVNGKREEEGYDKRVAEARAKLAEAATKHSNASKDLRARDTLYQPKIRTQQDDHESLKVVNEEIDRRLHKDDLEGRKQAGEVLSALYRTGSYKPATDHPVHAADKVLSQAAINKAVVALTNNGFLNKIGGNLDIPFSGGLKLGHVMGTLKPEMGSHTPVWQFDSNTGKVFDSSLPRGKGVEFDIEDLRKTGYVNQGHIDRLMTTPGMLKAADDKARDSDVKAAKAKKDDDERAAARKAAKPITLRSTDLPPEFSWAE